MLDIIEQVNESVDQHTSKKLERMNKIKGFQKEQDDRYKEKQVLKRKEIDEAKKRLKQKKRPSIEEKEAPASSKKSSKKVGFVDA